MRKTFLLTSWLVIFSLAVSLSFPLNLLAATVTYDADTTISLPNGVSLTILNGSLVESLVVKDDSSIVTTFGADTNITIRSSAGNAFSVDGATVNASGSGAVGVCSPGDYNQIQFTKTSGTATTTFTTNISCLASTGGGGGGGGSALPIMVIPTNTEVSINGDDPTTDNSTITLTLSASDATFMLVSNKADFSDATVWENYSVTKNWTLESGLGIKTVYVKFKSSSGGESSVVSDTIELVEAVEAITSDIDGTVGGSASLADDKVFVDFPSNAISGNGTLSITPTNNYINPTSGKKIVGSQVYDITVNSDGVDVTTFQELVTLKFSYTDAEIVGLDESSLEIYFWDEENTSWISFGGDVDVDNNIITRQTSHFTTFAIVGTFKSGDVGQLIKLECGANPGVNDSCRAVYYVGNNGKRYVFPNQKTYNTWYSDFSGVTTVSAEVMAGHAIGGNITYKPGVKLVKIQTDPKVYAVSMNGSLRWLSTGEIASSLYGSNWSSVVEDIPDAFFVNYKAGNDIENIADYNVADVLSLSSNINTDKGL